MRLLRVHCAVLNARTSILVRTCSQSYGGHGERETPGHIPNPEAKPLSADGTALETGWESRTPLDNHSRRGPSIRAGAPSSCPETLLLVPKAGEWADFPCCRVTGAESNARVVWAGPGAGHCRWAEHAASAHRSSA